MYEFLPSCSLPVHDGTTYEKQREIYHQIWEDIRNHGCCKVRVINNEQVLQLYQQQADELHTMLCKDKTTPNGSKTMGGIVKKYGAGAHPYAVEWRLNDIIRSLFAILYQDQKENMTVSNDAICLLGEDAKRGPWSRSVQTEEASFFRKTGGKLAGHIDTNPVYGTVGFYMANELKQENKYFLQSSLTLKPVPKGGATFVYADVPIDDAKNPFVTNALGNQAEAYNLSYSSDFTTLTESGYYHFRNTWKQVDDVPAGTLILFAGVHSNKLADFGCASNARAAIYICWLSRKYMNGWNEEIKRQHKQNKINSLLKGRTTDHNPIAYNCSSYGGSHYSNGKGRTKVMFGGNNAPVYSPELMSRIYEAM